MHDITIDKSAMRMELKSKLDGMTEQNRQKESAAIYTRFMHLPEVESSRVFSVYTSFPPEVDTKMIIRALLADGKTVVTPEKPDGKTIDVYIVPGLAFDHRCRRLGRGGGFYDKKLRDFSGPKIALAFSVQVVAQVPVTSYDVPMDKVITANETISV